MRESQHSDSDRETDRHTNSNTKPSHDCSNFTLRYFTLEEMVIVRYEGSSFPGRVMEINIMIVAQLSMLCRSANQLAGNGQHCQIVLCTLVMRLWRRSRVIASYRTMTGECLKLSLKSCRCGNQVFPLIDFEYINKLLIDFLSIVYWFSVHSLTVIYILCFCNKLLNKNFFNLSPLDYMKKTAKMPGAFMFHIFKNYLVIKVRDSSPKW